MTTVDRRSAAPRPRNAALLVLAGLALAAPPGVAAAPQAHPASAPPPPSDRIEIGAEERARTENWDNLSDFGNAARDARHQLRFRTRLWAKLDLGSRLEALV